MKDRIEYYTIRELKQAGKSDEQIMKHLKLSPSKYAKYRDKLQEYERTQVENLILEDVAFEVKSYIDDLHKAINVCGEITKNSSSSVEKLESEKMKFFCHTELLRIYQSGPQIIASMQVAPVLQKAFKTIKEKGEDIVGVEIHPVEEEDKKDGEQKNKKN